MKKLVLFFSLLVSVTASAALSPDDLSSFTIKNTIPNPGFEELLHGWSSSGGTLGAGGSPTPASGLAVASWTPSATGQTLNSTTVAIPAGLYGGNCIAWAFVKGGDSNLTMEVTDGGSTVLASAPLYTLTNYTKIFTPSFTCPTSGNFALRLRNTGSTVAATVRLDDVYLGYNPLAPGALGMAGSDTISETYSFSAGFGTTGQTSFRTRMGDQLVANIKVTTGTTAASVAYVQLPSGLNVDASKLTANSVLGKWQRVNSSTVSTQTLTEFGPVYYNGVSNQLYLAYQTGSGALQPANVSSILASGDAADIVFSVPIAGWSSNVTMAQSSTFRISSYLANGTRVTAAPTALGQYRSYLRGAGSRTYSDTNGAPSTGPSSLNGMQIWAGSGFATADTTNQPTRYDIFIGKSMYYRVQAYSTTGFSGNVDISPITNFGGSTSVGYVTSYDPSSGILSITKYTQDGSFTVAACGLDSTGTNVNTSVYFDVIVSQNALAVGVQAPRSEVLAYTGSGFGSTNTGVRHFANATTTGSAVTYFGSTTFGDTFTINEDGLYDLSYSDTGGTADYAGVTKNCSTLTTNVSTISPTNGKLSVGTFAAGLISFAHATTHLSAGDVIRAQGSTTTADYSNTSDNTMFRIAKVSN